MSEIDWSRLKASEIKALAQRNAVVIVPIGATEQHGPHLPVGTDRFTVERRCGGGHLRIGTGEKALHPI